jgi:hypothetical protein
LLPILKLLSVHLHSPFQWIGIYFFCVFVLSVSQSFCGSLLYFVASYFVLPVGRSGNGLMILLSVLWPSIFSSFQTSFCCRRKNSGHSFEISITCALYVFRVCGVTSIGQFANGLLENLNTVLSSFDVRDMIIYVGTRKLMLSSLISSPG